MKLRPITRYPSVRYPQAGSAAESVDLARTLPRRWRAQPKVVAALAACLVLSGCGGGPVSQRVQDAVDRAAVALHLKQPPPVRLMGAVGPPTYPIPNSRPTAPAPARPSQPQHKARGQKA